MFRSIKNQSVMPHLNFSGLQDTTLALDFRVTILESDVNSSVAELEVRVEILEGTAVDHETRISTTESDVTGRKRTVTVFNKSYDNELWSHFEYIYFRSGRSSRRPRDPTDGSGRKHTRYKEMSKIISIALNYMCYL